MVPTIIFIVSAAVGFLTNAIFHYQGKSTWKSIAAGVATFIIVFIGALLIYKQESKIQNTDDLFRIELRLSMLFPSKDLVTNYAMIHPGSNTASPIDVMLYVQLTNKQNIPSLISRYSVEIAAAGNGPWEELLPMSITGGQEVYLIPGHEHKVLTDAIVIDMSQDGLENILRKRPLSPHETVIGWLLFASKPKRAKEGYSYRFPIANFYRFFFRDAAGSETQQIVSARRTVKGHDLRDGAPLRFGQRKDLSNFRFKEYGQ
jgi:hypothetical protein